MEEIFNTIIAENKTKCSVSPLIKTNTRNSTVHVFTSHLPVCCLMSIKYDIFYSIQQK